MYITTEKEYLKAGTYEVTVNFDISKPFKLTPDIWIHYSMLCSPNDVAKLGVERIVTQGVTGISYVLSMDVPASGTKDGVAYFWVQTTKDSGLVVLLNSDIMSAGYINGRNRVVLDTQINNPQGFEMFDKDSPTVTKDVNDFSVGVRYTANSDYYAWMLGEGVSYQDQPAITDKRWVYQDPADYTFQNLNVEKKVVYFWVMDRAHNISTSSVSANINYNPLAQPPAGYTSVQLSTRYVSVGQMNITLNIKDSNISTPNMWLSLSGNLITLNLYKCITVDATNSFYMATLNILADSYDGAAHFELSATRSSLQVVNYTGSNYINIEGDRDIVIDTKIDLPPTFYVSDKNTGLSAKTNNLIVNVNLSDSVDYYAWMMGEEYNSRPAANDSHWSFVKPSEYNFRNLQSGIKTIHLWIKDRADNVTTTDSQTTIEYNPDEIGSSQYATIYTNLGASIFPGVLQVTLNIIDIKSALDSLPSMNLVLLNGTVLPIYLTLKSTDNASGTYYFATLNIAKDESYQGQAYFQVAVTRNNNSRFSAQTKIEAGALMGGASLVNIFVPVLKVSSLNPLSSSLYAGDTDVRAAELTLNNNTDFMYVDTVKISISGNVFDSDIESIYIGKVSDRDSESIVALTNKANFKNNRALLKFSGTEIPAVNGSKYFVVLNVNKNAVVGNSFNLYIASVDVFLSHGGEPASTNFPLTTPLFSISKQRNQVLLKNYALPTFNVSIGQKNVVLADFSLRTLKGTSYLSSTSIEKTNSVSDNMFYNVRLYKKAVVGGGNTAKY